LLKLQNYRNTKFKTYKKHKLIFLVAFFIFLINLPCGYLRAGFRKLSPAWFIAIHAPVPFIVFMRYYFEIPWELFSSLLFVTFFFSGQWVGTKLHKIF